MAGSLNDQMKAYYDAAIDGTGIPTSIPLVQQSFSATDTTAVAAPGAGATIATVVNPPAGTYEVVVNSFIGGTTVAANEVTNMRLTVGGIAVGRILNSVPGTSGAVSVTQTKFRVVVNGAQSINVIAVAAATAGSIYSASIVASRIA